MESSDDEMRIEEARKDENTGPEKEIVNGRGKEDGPRVDTEDEDEESDASSNQKRRSKRTSKRENNRRKAFLPSSLPSVVSLENEEQIRKTRALANRTKRKRPLGEENHEKDENYSEREEEESSSSGLEDEAQQLAHKIAQAKRQSLKQLPASEQRNNPAEFHAFTPAFPEELEVEKIVSFRLQNKVEHYLVKWRGFSYLHCEWRSRQTLQQMDKRNAGRIDKFNIDNDIEILEGDEADADDASSASDSDYFSQAFTTVHRFLGYYEVDLPKGTLAPFKTPFGQKPGPALDAAGKAKKDMDGNGLLRFAYVLVKWTSLSYAEITWEPVSVLDPEEYQQKMKEFKLFNRPDILAFGKRYATLGKPLGRTRSKDFRKIDEDSKYTGLDGVTTNLRLRDYQVEGVNWLLWNWWNQRPGSLLADEMGLGKTIQVVAFLEELRSGRTVSEAANRGQAKLRTKGPHLIVVPLSCVIQWQREFETWTNMNSIIFHGNADAREETQFYEFHYRRTEVWNGEDGRKIHQNEFMKFDALVTTYEIAVREAALLRRIPWRALIVDEAHRLKNRGSKLFSELKAYTRDYTILLTGTPIQNNTEELWAMMNFLVSAQAPSGSQSSKRRKQNGNGRTQEGNSDENETFWFTEEKREDFMEEFGSVTSHSQVSKLHELLRPFLLRRVKEDVGKSLPPKKETIVEVELTVEQKKFYRGIYEKNTKFLYRGQKPTNGPSLMNVMMELRKCCNHPFLNRGLEEMIVHDDETGETMEEKRSRLLVASSGKLVLLDKLLPRLISSDHKVLIFSQMVRMLDLLEDYLHLRNIQCERLDGSIKGIDRQAAIDRFSAEDSKAHIMLLSTRAGGLGLNLACADTVIIYDSDWNPQNDLQAQARSHRIGQTRPVTIYRLLTRKTYEMVMFEKASMKLGLDRAMLSADELGSSKKNEKTNKAGLTAAEVDHILKNGAYAAFGEDEEKSKEESKKYLNATIDEILNTASHIVDYTELAKKEQKGALSNFSKAVFTSKKSADEENVDIDDPEFWRKVAGFEHQPEDEIHKRLGLSSDHVLRTGIKRQRRNVTRFRIGEGDGESDEGSCGGPVQKVVVKKKSVSKRPKSALAWSDRARARITEGLEKFGWGRWERIREYYNLENYGEVDRISRFAAACMKVAFAYAKDENSRPPRSQRGLPFSAEKTCKSILKQAIRMNLSDMEQEQAERVLTKPAFINKMLQGGAQSLLLKVQLLQHIQLLTSTAEQQATAKLLQALAIDDLDDLYIARDRTESNFAYKIDMRRPSASGIVIGTVMDEQNKSVKRWIIKSIAPDSPAAHSMFVRVGDEIRSVNGFPASKLTQLFSFAEALFTPKQCDIELDGDEYMDHKDQDSYADFEIEDDEEDEIENNSFEEKGLRCERVLVIEARGPPSKEESAARPFEMDVFKYKDEEVEIVESEASKETRFSTSDLELELLNFADQSEDETFSPGWPHPKMAAWLAKRLEGRPSLKPLKAFLVSRRVGLESANADEVCALVQELRKKDQRENAKGKGDTSGSFDELPREGVMLLNDEKDYDRIMTERTVQELHELDVFAKPEVPDLRKMKLKDGSFWTREMDCYLVIGIIRHGLGEAEMHLIASDPSLIFARKFGLVKIKEMMGARNEVEKHNEEVRKLRAKKGQRDRRRKKEIEDALRLSGPQAKLAMLNAYAAEPQSEIPPSRHVPPGPGDLLPKFETILDHVNLILYKDFEQ